MKTIEITPERVVDADNFLGETPVWSTEEQSLYWVNCENPPELHRWNPESGKHDIWPMPERIGGLALKQGGGILLVLAGGLYDMDFSTGERTLVASSPMDHAALHESACDRQGRLWVGGIDHNISLEEKLPPAASLFRLDGVTLTEMISGMYCANGLVVSPDGGTLYQTDTMVGTVFAWDLDADTGAITNKRDFFHVPQDQGMLDGATVDAEGGYWIALIVAGRLRRYLPDGTLEREIVLPFSTPTKPAFGGVDLDTLYLTTTKMPLGGSPSDGGLYAFKPGFRGLPEPLLAR